MKVKKYNSSFADLYIKPGQLNTSLHRQVRDFAWAPTSLTSLPKAFTVCSSIWPHPLPTIASVFSLLMGPTTISLTLSPPLHRWISSQSPLYSKFCLALSQYRLNILMETKILPTKSKTIHTKMCQFLPTNTLWTNHSTVARLRRESVGKG